MLAGPNTAGEEQDELGLLALSLRKIKPVKVWDIFIIGRTYLKATRAKPRP